MAKNAAQGTATATLPTTTPTVSEPTHTVVVCFDRDAEPVVSVAPAQIAVHPDDTITFTLDASAPPGAKFHTDPKDATLPLVAWGSGGDWDVHKSQLKSKTWGVTDVTTNEQGAPTFKMRAPAVGTEYEHAGVFTYTIAVEFDSQVYYAGDPTIVNEPVPA